MKHALICGVTGQDGAYLAKFLLGKDYIVFGTSRDAQGSDLSNLKRLGISDKIHMLTMVPNDFRSVMLAIDKAEPDEVYYLAGQSSVSLSFDQPVEAIESIALGTLNILEAIRFISKDIRLYNAGSSECFGDTGVKPATEDTHFRPRSPYAVAKCAAFWQVANYREAYGLFSCTGILFNHESPLRPRRFVTKKVVETALRISQGSTEVLTLGNIDIVRDWGCAPDYVEAMWLMLKCEYPQDFVIATGHSYSLRQFVELVFIKLGLDWRSHVLTSDDLFRPSDILVSRANPSKAREELKWAAKRDFDTMVIWLIESVDN